jgi:hypothetical protein
MLGAFLAAFVRWSVAGRCRMRVCRRQGNPAPEADGCLQVSIDRANGVHAQDGLKKSTGRSSSLITRNYFRSSPSTKSSNLELLPCQMVSRPVHRLSEIW